MNAPHPSSLQYPAAPQPAVTSIGVCMELLLALLILVFTSGTASGAVLSVDVTDASGQRLPVTAHSIEVEQDARLKVANEP